VAQLATAEPPLAVWHLYQQGETAVAALREGLASEDADTRWWSAVALAMANHAEAAPYLREVLKARDPQLPTTNPEEPSYYLKRMAPRWVSAMVLLGRLRDREAVPLLGEVLAEAVPEVDWLLAAIRALGRIAEPSGAAAVRQLLARADLPTSAELQNSFREQAQQARDVKWQLHLTAAEALAEMGDPAPELSAPYLQDERAYVRAYAARVRD
jgi:HEAT repeat protein